MNIKIDPLTFEAWDEMYFIITNLDDVEGCRHLKVKGLTTKYKNGINITICFLLALILIFILALIKSRHPEIHIIVGSFLLTCTFYVLLYNLDIYRTIKKDINRRINTEYKTTSLKINKDVVDPDDVEMLEDTILAAVNDALKQGEDNREAQMSKLSGATGMGGLF